MQHVNNLDYFGEFKKDDGVIFKDWQWYRTASSLQSGELLDSDTQNPSQNAFYRSTAVNRPGWSPNTVINGTPDHVYTIQDFDSVTQGVPGRWLQPSKPAIPLGYMDVTLFFNLDVAAESMDANAQAYNQAAYWDESFIFWEYEARGFVDTNAPFAINLVQPPLAGVYWVNGRNQRDITKKFNGTGFGWRDFNSISLLARPGSNYEDISGPTANQAAATETWTQPKKR
jgi:hypothetical protein